MGWATESGLTMPGWQIDFDDHRQWLECPPVPFGDDTLVIWNSAQNSLRPPHAGTYAARVSRDGVVRDVGGIGFASWISLEAASNGQDCAVLVSLRQWQSAGEALLGMHILSVDTFPDGIKTLTLPVLYWGAKVASNGSKFLVLTHGTTGLFRLWTIDRNGTLIAVTEIQVPQEFGHRGDFALAGTASGENVLVVWNNVAPAGSEFAGVVAMLLDGAGTLRSGYPLVVSRRQGIPRVAADENGFFVTWTYYPASDHLAAYGAYIPIGQPPVMEEKLLFSTPRSKALLTTWGGLGSLVQQHGHAQFLVQRDANHIVSIPWLASGDEMQEQVVATATKGMASWHGVLRDDAILVAWSEPVVQHLAGFPPTVFRVMAQKADLAVSSGGVVSMPLRISEAVEGLDRVAVAHGGGTGLVVWTEQGNYRTTGTDVSASRVSGSGELLDSTGLPVCGRQGHQRNPVATFAGDHFLVVWEEETGRAERGIDLFGARVGLDGTVLDPESFPIASGPGDQRQPVVTWDGINVFVVWEDQLAGRDTGRDILGVRVRNGKVIDPAPILVCDAEGEQHLPAVASGAESTLVVWQDGREAGMFRIHGTRLTSEGQRLDGDGFVICTGTPIQAIPRVASNGSLWLCVWQEARNPRGGAADVYAARISADGRALDLEGIPVVTSPATEKWPDVTNTGEDFTIAWHTDRPLVGRVGGEVSLARMNSFGIVIDRLPTAIRSEEWSQVRPVLVGQADGRVLVGTQSAIKDRAVVLADLVGYAFDDLRVFSATAIGRDMALTWSSTPGRRYRYEYATRLPAPFWVGPSQVFTARGHTTSVVDGEARGASERYYRVLELP